MRFRFVSETMGEPDGEKPKPRKRLRRWLRRIGVVLLILLGILVVFHRPIIFEGTRYFVVRAAKQQNLDLSYDIDGSIFTTLTIRNLKGVPTEPGPIQRLEIGTIDLKYSLWGALRHGLPALLDLVQIKDVYVEITPAEQPPPGKREGPQQLKFPALFPRTLQLENVNFLSHAKAGDTVVKSLWLTLLPDKPGVLKVTTLDVPGVHKWADIDGRTTFHDRNLFLTDFRIGPEIQLEKFNLDASNLDDAKLAVSLEGRFFEAPVTAAVRIADLNAGTDLTADVTAQGLVFQRIWNYLGMEIPFTGTLDNAAVHFAGKPEEPQSWSGNVDVSLSGLALGAQPAGSVTAKVAIAEQTAHVDLVDAFDADNSVRLSAAAQLPEKLSGFPGAKVEGSALVSVGDLGVVTGDKSASGDLSGRIDFQLADGIFTANGSLASKAIAASDAKLEGASIGLKLRRNLNVEKDAPVFAETALGVTAGVERVQFQDYDANAVVLDLQSDGAKVTLRELSLKKGGNSVRMGGSYTLPGDMASFAKQPWTGEVHVKAPALNEFLATDASAELRGSLSVEGSAKSDGRNITGDFTIEGRDIASNGLTVPTLDGRLTIGDDLARLTDLAIVFDEDNQIHASGDIQLKEPYVYNGRIHADLANLSIFAPVSPEPLAGSLKLDWEGLGDVRKATHSGNGMLVLTNGQYGANAALNADIQAHYTPEMIDIPVLQASAEMGGIAAKAHWENNQLEVTDLVAKLRDLTVLQGSLALPLDIRHADNPDLLIPNDGAVSANLEMPKLQLADIFQAIGNDEPPVTGTVAAKFAASGTVGDLAADLGFQAADLASPAAADVESANVNLALALRDNRLTVEGKVTQPRINPLVVSGSLPVDVARIKRERALPLDTPVDLSVQMANSSLAFVANLVPAIRFIDGTAGVDLKVSGTTSKPKIAGNLSADIKAIRLSDEGLPPISNTVVRIDSTTEKLTISQFHGEIAGGAFGAEGSIDFSNLEKPVFHLKFGSRNALVLQDEAITLRLSSRINVEGPLDAATVSGEVYVVRSRFYKNIDILPIGLPGRPAPEPPPAPPAPGIPDPPLRDWKLDIAVRTADPFLVQGNLANGRITIDLHVGGTGMRPWVDGSVNIEQLTTSLPFSTLEITNGLVYFQRNDPFMPKFDIRGRSQIRDYDVTAYIYGDLDDPQAQFTSNPPLPQTDIVSLIATGVTSRELAGNPSVLAGKAAILLAQKIYRSVFDRNSSGPPRNTLLSRIDIDVGSTDPKTGRQGLGIRFPITDNIVLTSGVDVGGDFRGQVRYLIRFR